MNVRIAIVAESFPPDVNGVAHCTLRVAEHLVARGHHPLVVAPASARGAPGAAGPFPCPVVRLRSVPVPRYRNFRVAVPRRCTDLVPYLLVMALRECWPGPGPRPPVVPPLRLPEPVPAQPDPGPEIGLTGTGMPEIGHAP